MKDALAGVCIGILLFFGSGGLLFWNEGRSVKRQTDLDEGRGIVERVGMVKIGDTISKRRDNDLVYIAGLVDAGDHVIFDDGFSLNVTDATNAIKYERSVEMYQWVESEDIDPKTGATRTKTNRSGGIQGGISNGENIVVHVAFKPTSTIGQAQVRTVQNLQMGLFLAV